MKEDSPKAEMTTNKKVGSKNAPEESKTEQLPIPKIDGPHAQVRFGFGLTINLGNFESARLDVHLTYPSAANPEAVEATFERVKTWVDAKMEQEINEIKSNK